MEPKFQSSFIPKNPVVAAGASSVTPVRTTNLFSVIAGIVFVITVLASGGLYFYKGIVTKQIADDDASLTATRASFQPDKIQQLIDANSRILSTKTLLENHVVLSDLLSLLSQLAVKNIRFGTLTYAIKANTPTLSIDLNSVGYNALAAQESILAQNSSLKNISFSNVALGDNGAVQINFFADLDPSILSYKNSVEGSTANTTNTTSNTANVINAVVGPPANTSTTTQQTP